jgi:hypothetical protein
MARGDAESSSPFDAEEAMTTVVAIGAHEDEATLQKALGAARAA